MSGASVSAAPPKPDGPIRAAASFEKWRRLRWIPLAAGAGALLVGLWVGLARLGLALPGGMPARAEFHSALMISGFLGTVISLERAVAIGQPGPLFRLQPRRVRRPIGQQLPGHEAHDDRRQTLDDEQPLPTLQVPNRRLILMVLINKRDCA